MSVSMRCGLAVFLFVLGARSVSAQPSAAAPTARPVYGPEDTRADILKRMDGWLGAMAAADSFSGVVAVAQHGKIIWSRAAGIADERTKAANTVATRFTLASMGKMFTATAIAQLVEQGKISPNDTVGKFLPDFPNRDVAQRVTIAQLLTHTSGLGSFWNDRYAARRASLLTLADYVPLFAGDPLLFTPGERWEYSNSGYIVLGLIIEAVSGMSYYDYVQRHIFDRAGMPNAGYYDRSGTVTNGAVGYTRGDGAGSPLRDNLGERELRGSSAGGGYASAADMAAFLEALEKDRLVGARTRELFTAGKVDGPFGPKNYGYGFILRSRADTVVAVGHTGGFPGMTTQAFYYMKGGYALVVLLNRSGGVVGPVMGETSRAVAALSARAAQ